MPRALSGLSNGATVTDWADTSGLGNNTTAAATGSVATYPTNALNGKPVVRFNPNGNASFNFVSRVSDIRTVFWVFKRKCRCPRLSFHPAGDDATESPRF